MTRFSLRRLDRRWWWIGLGVVSLLLRFLFGALPGLCETLYSRGLFLGIRISIDYTTALLPFPMIYPFLAVMLFVMGRALYRAVKALLLKVRRRSPSSWLGLLGGGLLSLGGFVGFLTTFFLWIWGFNYARIPLKEQIALETKPLSHVDLMLEAEYILERCTTTRALIPQADTNALRPEHFPEDLEGHLRECLVRALDKMGYPTVGRVRGRWLHPAGSLYRFGATGVYMPFVGEGHVDPALHCSQQAFTMGHELGHGYGFGNEAECNFLGYLACMESPDPAVQYSGYLTYWRYVFGELRSIDRDCYSELRGLVPPGMHNDVLAIYDVADRYPEFFPKIQRAAYNFYLQSQGVKEGVLSYNQMLLFVSAWRKREGK